MKYFIKTYLVSAIVGVLFAAATVYAALLTVSEGGTGAGSFTADGIIIGHSTSSLTASSNFVYTSGGNVGIGTTSPSAILQVRPASNKNFGVNDGTAIGFAGPQLFAINDAFNAYLPMGIQGGPLLLNPTSGGNVGVGNSSPQSKLDIGTEANAVAEYIRIDAESGAPTSTDCDSVTERGRMLLDYTNNRLYICNENASSTRGWDYLNLTD